jgi:hypothetical protein
MKTIVNIPYEPAPVDPNWMYKVRIGKKLNPSEMEE